MATATLARKRSGLFFGPNRLQQAQGPLEIAGGHRLGHHAAGAGVGVLGAQLCRHVARFVEEFPTGILVAQTDQRDFRPRPDIPPATADRPPGPRPANSSAHRMAFAGSETV